MKKYLEQTMRYEVWWEHPVNGWEIRKRSTDYDWIVKNMGKSRRFMLVSVMENRQFVKQGDWVSL